MLRNAIKRDFVASKMAGDGHFEKKHLKRVAYWNGEKYDQKWFLGL